MELSILLAEQILSMFLTMIVGYIIVKIGLFKETDSKIISNMVVYICSPCVIIDAFQIELTDDKLQGLLIAVVAAICVHIVMIGGTKLMEKPLHFNRIEKASVIYSNSGYLLIPLVGNVLGKEWVFYTTAYNLVQTVLLWTHAVGIISKKDEKNYKEIFLNPNMIAMFLGMLMFISRIRLPQVIGTCVSSFGDMIGAVDSVCSRLFNLRNALLYFVTGKLRLLRLKQTTTNGIDSTYHISETAYTCSDHLWKPNPGYEHKHSKKHSNHIRIQEYLFIILFVFFADDSDCMRPE